MHMLLAFLFLLTSVFLTCDNFFLNPPFQLNKIQNPRNISCLSDSDDTDYNIGCDYCVYEFFSNGTDFTISHDCIYLTNSYRLVTQRCSGFTNTSDIGYGLCSQLPFEYFDIDLLCICPTDFCNENLTTCKQSVNANPNLPSLPSIIVESSTITCQDTRLGILNTTYYCERDSTPYINLTQCEKYVQDHTVLCMYLEADNGSYLTIVALPDEDYEYVLINQIQLMQDMASRSNVKQYYNETTDAFYIQWREILENIDNYTMIYNKCYCKTNNCNINLTACLQSHIEVNIGNKKIYNMILISIIMIFNVYFYFYFFSFQ